MASFKLNIASIRGCPSPQKITAALAEFGLPDSEEFGVLNHSAASQAVYATIVRRTEQTVQSLDAEAKEVTSRAVEKATVYPFGVMPERERVEVYAGTASAIEQVGIFLSSCLALPVVVEPIELDVPSVIERIAAETERFQLRSIRISEYAHDSYMSGVYAPKFLDSDHGKEFLNEYLEYVTAASVRFSGPNGKIGITLNPKACFSYSCHEDDQPLAQSLLRKLA